MNWARSMPRSTRYRPGPVQYCACSTASKPAPICARRRTRCIVPWVRSCPRSEEHTSELQSLMRISYAVFCLKKKTQDCTHNTTPDMTNSHHHNTYNMQHSKLLSLQIN